MNRDLISKPPVSMKSLLKQADDFSWADEADNKKRKEIKQTDKEKGKKLELGWEGEACWTGSDVPDLPELISHNGNTLLL